MLSYEQLGKMVLEILSGSFIVSKWKAVCNCMLRSPIADSIHPGEQYVQYGDGVWLVLEVRSDL